MERFAREKDNVSKLAELAQRLEIVAGSPTGNQICEEAAAALRECEAVLRETAAFDDGDSVYWWGNPQDSVMKRIRKLLGD